MSPNDGFYKKILDNLYDGIYFVDGKRRISYWNKGAENLTGYTEAEVSLKECREVFMHLGIQGGDLCDNGCPIEQTMQDGLKREIDSYFHHKEGHLVPVCLRVAPITDSKGEMVIAVEVTGDNSPRHALRQQLEQLQLLALCDPLTTLANRRYIEMNLTARLEELKRYGWSFGILFMDIDHFKRINDTYGHDAGDRVLTMVSRTLMNSTRPFDMVGRWGGEEFIAILANITQEHLVMIAERFRILVEQSHFRQGNDTISVTVSIGATLARPDDTVEELVRRADSLMYQSKDAGRNFVSVSFDGPDTDGAGGLAVSAK